MLLAAWLPWTVCYKVDLVFDHVSEAANERGARGKRLGKKFAIYAVVRVPIFFVRKIAPHLHDISERQSAAGEYARDVLISPPRLVFKSVGNDLIVFVNRSQPGQKNEVAGSYAGREWQGAFDAFQVAER